MKLLLAIAAGGAIGAVGRHFVSAQVGHWLGHGFPYGTLAVNVVGSFAMGVLVEAIALAWGPSQEMRAFLTVGLLGAFTTFSTFSLDVVLLSERGAVLPALLYIAVSVILCVGALFLGLWAMRAVWL
jgi:CrcB protein